MSHFVLNGTRWSPTHATVSWAIATQNFANQPGGAFSTFITDQIIINDITNAFSQWDAASGLSFQMVPDSADVDIRFGFGPVDGQGRLIAHDTLSVDSGTDFTIAATVRFDNAENYFTQGNEVYVNNTNNPMTSVALHEIGHTLGLDHYAGDPAVMNGASGTNVTLRSSDIHGIQFLYGAHDVVSLGDVLWRHLDGRVATADHHLGAVPNNWRIAGVGDFDGDGDSDILWRHIDGPVVTWEMENGQYLTNHHIAFASIGWEILNTGDFDGDSDSDILWRHTDGAVVTWEMENGEYVTNHNIAFASIGWRIDGLGDFDADGDSDIIWRHRDGAVVTWEMENGDYVQNHNIAFASTGWDIRGTGDFDGDGDADILWRHRDGAVVTWEMENGAYVVNHNIAFASTGWTIQGTGDFDGDGDADILWRHTAGTVVTWEMDGGEFLQTHNFGVTGNDWQIRGTGEFDLV